MTDDYPDEMIVSIDDFETIYKMFYKPLVRKTYTRTFDLDAAHDIVQDVFMILLNDEKIEKHFPARKASILNIRCFLFVCARYRFYGYKYRMRQKERFIQKWGCDLCRAEIKSLNPLSIKAKNESKQEETLLLNEDIKEIRAAAMKLPTDMLTLVRMKFWQNLSKNKIAEKTKVNISKVERLLTTATVLLASELS
jgi:DNA-directed RNA polymerase specialized sigma24 family protein